MTVFQMQICDIRPYSRNPRVRVGNEIVVALAPGADPEQVIGERFSDYRALYGTSDQFVITLPSADPGEVIQWASLLDQGDAFSWAAPDL